MTDSEKAKIITLWHNGMTIKQIRQITPMPTREFNSAIRDMKRNGEFPQKRMTARDKILEACKNGETNHYVLADTYGVTLATAAQYRKLSGVCNGKRPKHNYRHKPKTLAIIADLKLGTMKISEIARKHGVCWQYVKDLKVKWEIDNYEQR